MIGLCAIYVVIAALSAYERNWPRVLYWVAATLLNVSVIWATKVSQ
jgi:hypothetical protein